MVNIPKLMKKRPIYNGIVVPYFVAWYKGNEMVAEHEPLAKPDFRVVNQYRANICRKHNACWICGKRLGRFKWFVFGPGSALGRVSVEPPSHSECAHYAVQVCPYLLSTTKTHRDGELRSAEYIFPDVDTYHPGVAVLWASKGYSLIPVDPPRGIFYYNPGDPVSVEFWREGRKATRAEIEASVVQVLERNPRAKKEPDMGWRIEQLMRFAPAEEAA